MFLYKQTVRVFIKCFFLPRGVSKRDNTTFKKLFGIFLALQILLHPREDLFLGLDPFYKKFIFVKPCPQTLSPQTP